MAARADRLPIERISSTMATNDEIEAEVLSLLDAWMSAFNRQDLKAWYATFHFPHYRLASGRMTILEAPGGEQTWQQPLRSSGWHHSAWNRRQLVHVSDTKVHVDTQFTRYREDGTVIATYESLYVLTKRQGRWGVELRSSFAP